MMDYNNVDSTQNIHSLGVSYLGNFLDRVGFTILEVNTGPHHPFQLLVRINNKYLSIVVRTACHPAVGTIDSSALETLIGESEEQGFTPHFAGLSVIPMETNSIKINGSAEGQEYKVIFNGISAVHKSELLAVNV